MKMKRIETAGGKRVEALSKERGKKQIRRNRLQIKFPDSRLRAMAEGMSRVTTPVSVEKQIAPAAGNRRR